MRRIHEWCLSVAVTCLVTFNASALDLDFKGGNLDGWKEVGGVWKVNGGVLEGTTGGYQDLMLDYDGSDNWTDYTWEVKGKLLAGRVWGVCFRYVDTNTNYRLNLYEDLDGVNNLYIYKRVAGTFSEVFKVPVGKIDKDVWYTLKLEIIGNAMKAYLNDELKIEADDKNAPIDKGTIALQGETNTMFQVESVKIEGKGIPSSLAVFPAGKLAATWGTMKRAAE